MPQCSFPALNNRPVGHGPVCTDENYDVILFRPRQESTRTAFWNHLASEVKALDDRDFQTFKHEAVNLLSSIHSRTEERTHQQQQPQKPTLSRSFSATYVVQQPQQPAPASRECILIIPETHMPSRQVIQPAQQLLLMAIGLDLQAQQLLLMAIGPDLKDCLLSY